MSIVTSWSPFFQSQRRMRGRGLQNAGRVKLLPASNGEVLRAEIEDSGTHHVEFRHEGADAWAECTCEAFADGAYCEHIWATIMQLALTEEPVSPELSPERLAGLRVRAPRARKREDGGVAVRSHAEPAWMSRLTLLRPPMLDDPRGGFDLLPPQRQVAYVVLPEASTRHGGLVMELRQRTPLPTGTGWSKPKPLRLMAEALPSLPEPIDRELCALVLGSGRVEDGQLVEGVRGERSYCRFRLPGAAQRVLLERMIETGRCYIDLDENGSGREAPLHWDDAGALGTWTLWVVGDETAERELTIRAELRRRHERMPIEAPHLVVTGLEGVIFWQDRAGPLDDRGAPRWISQFRGEGRSGQSVGGGGPGPLRVAAGDVERFLDRMYMLPQLPEIDLPEALTRNEHRIKPAPHLDLFSADAALNGHAKSQLLARVWFDYAGVRVSPTQPGRFVTVTGETPEAPQTTAASTAALPPEASPAVNGHAEATAADPIVDEERPGLDDASVEAPDEPIVAAEGTKLVRRDLQAEREAFAQLAAVGLRPSGGNPESMLLPIKAMPAVVSKLAAQGWVISADQHALRRPGAPSLTVSSGIDWFELRGTVTYDRADGEQQEVNLPDILAAVRRGEQMITLGDGSRGLLPEEWLEEHGLLLALGRVGVEGLRFKSTQAAMLDALLSEQELLQVDETFAAARAKLREFQGLRPVDPRPDFRGLLRPYQKEGLGWLDFLRHFGFGGVLADDMGLGKTIQVLAMLQARGRGRLSDHAEGATEHRPSLVVAPRSLVFNWLDEAQKFTPELRAVAYSGADRNVLRERFDELDLVVTSYGLLRRDIEDLRNFRFDYVILDEAQAIKNPNSQAAKAARLLQADHRLALTGTPVENHMGDLWSIFEFLNPGLLGSNARFGDMVRASGPAAEAASTPGGEGVDVSVQQVAKALRPFILRRTKKQVLADLPPKTEQTIVCEMEPAQREMYDGLKAYYRQHLLTQLDSPGAPGGGVTAAGMGDEPGVPQRAMTGNNSFMVLEALLRLRQASCHPGLIDPARADDPSAKLETLVEMLGDVIDEGGKALIFSQFTSMLSIVQRRLESQGTRFCYLDGQTRDRRREVDKFQNDPTIPVFLISLKAGGFGLNLTAAEYVFILDPWWNPAVEQQAIDRAHRIGQTQHVFAYRMICQDTVEQRIIELQNRKRRLADAIVDGQGDLLRTLTREDLEQLLS